MKTLLAVLLVLVIAAPIFAAVETWNNVPLVDSNCAAKVKDNPDAHTKDCAMQCAKSGLGILTSDGTFLKFDKKGQTDAMAALQSTSKTDHLRATVTGERSGDTVKVKTFKLD